MSWTHPRRIVWILCLTLVATGCFPTKPMYLNDTGQLSYYLDQATQIEHPDVHTAILDEVTQSQAPITIADPDFDSYWELRLEEAVSIALQNNKVIRGYGTPGLQGNRVAPGIDNLANNPAGAGTVYNVAVRESEPGFIGQPGQINAAGTVLSNTALDANQGVEAALADFDAQFTTSVFWDRTDTPRNTTSNRTIPGNAALFQQDSLNFQAQLAKRTATGTQLFIRQNTSYVDNNIPLVPFGFQALRSIWQTALELEVRQPLMRGRGAFINRMPVVISRIGTDQELANLEAQLQNMVANVEIRYWDLYCAYRALESAKLGRDSALYTWRKLYNQFKEGTLPPQREAQAREQYYFFTAEVERTWTELLDAESNLRFLMGIAATDSRLIRPADEPFKAPVEFDYATVLDEAISLRPELRQERWEVKKRQLALAYAKNSLLPSVNAVAQYRWLGLGDRLISYDGSAPDFPGANSGAWNDLMGGDYQEFRMGLEAGIPVGFRRELSNVNNAELKLARELARLEDMELDVARELQHSLRALKTNFQLAQTNFNRWIATTTEVESVTQRYELGRDALDLLLDAHRRRAQAELAYYQSLCEYNKVIALVHRRKGTSLAYCGVCMDEGPWAGKAYCDAAEYARQRSASRQVNYGWTRPEVISQGPLGDDCDCNTCLSGDQPVVEYIDNGGEYFEEYYVPSESSANPTTNTSNYQQPTPIDTNAIQPDWQRLPTESFEFDGEQPTLVPADSSTSTPTHSASQVTARISVPVGGGKTLSEPEIHTTSGSVARIKWEKMGLTKPANTGTTSSAVIRQVNHEE